MNMGEKEKYEMDHKNEDQMNYSPGISSDWRFDGSNLSNSSMGLVHPGNSMASSSCSSAPMVDSFVSTLWDRSTASQNLGFGERALEMCWNPGGPDPMLKGGLFLPNLLGGPIPQSLSQLPADSAFIERAARFSSFNAGNFGDIIANPFAGPKGMGLYARTGGQEAFAGNGLRRIELTNASEASKDASKEGLEKFRDEAKQVVSGSGNESDEAEFSSGVGVGRDEASVLECAGGEASGKGIGSKKRKRNVQDSDGQGKGVSNQTGDDTELQHKVDQNPSTTITNKASAKNGKQVPQASDPTKEDYIHVRARRGQATNSHSLAERVRREKISERMKFLQDLVPGCSKVTGKAVMLDEIINYVQSLQRQVEFLSMKLATVNPRLDFNLEGLMAKDMVQPRLVGSSSSLAFAPDIHMAYQTIQAPPQQGLVQPSILGMGSASDILRRTISSHLTPMPGGFKEPSQLPNVWEDELNNVVQMSFGTRNSPSSKDVDGSVESGQMKVEL